MKLEGDLNRKHSVGRISGSLFPIFPIIDFIGAAKDCVSEIIADSEATRTFSKIRNETVFTRTELKQF